MFSGCPVLPESKETGLESSDQEASPSAGKNTGVVLESCCAWKCDPTAIPWVSFVTTDESSVRVTKITSRIGIL